MVSCHFASPMAKMASRPSSPTANAATSICRVFLLAGSFTVPGSTRDGKPPVISSGAKYLTQCRHNCSKCGPRTFEVKRGSLRSHRRAGSRVCARSDQIGRITP